MEALQGKTVAVVGLGLMGGSLALALRPHGVRLVAVEPDEAARVQALARGVVDHATAVLADGVAGADLVVLAAPVRAIVDLLAALPGACPGGCTVLDLGSTKAAIIAAMDRLPPSFGAVGGHPMCGKESAGLAVADEHLFRNQTFILCRSARTNTAVEGLAQSLVVAVGAHPLWLDPAEHDRLVALVSHLPYFVAAALMAEAAGVARTTDQLWQVSASGFRDTTRLAGSDPRMMGDIAVTNREEIVAALQAYMSRLEEIIRRLESGDDVALMKWLAARQHEYAQSPSAKRRP